MQEEVDVQFSEIFIATSAHHNNFILSNHKLASFAAKIPHKSEDMYDVSLLASDGWCG